MHTHDFYGVCKYSRDVGVRYTHSDADARANELLRYNIRIPNGVFHLENIKYLEKSASVPTLFGYLNKSCAARENGRQRDRRPFTMGIHLLSTKIDLCRNAF